MFHWHEEDLCLERVGGLEGGFTQKALVFRDSPCLLIFLMKEVWGLKRSCLGSLKERISEIGISICLFVHPLIRRW